MSGGDSSLANAGARDDPLVGGVDHPLEVGVREDLRWRIASPADHVGVAATRSRAIAGIHRGSTSINGCLAFTNVPLSATIRATRPGMSDLISLNSFMASISPMTVPTAISEPTWT